MQNQRNILLQSLILTTRKFVFIFVQQRATLMMEQQGARFVMSIAALVVVQLCVQHASEVGFCTMENVFPTARN